jgi:SAM-dependent methyltransferase
MDSPLPRAPEVAAFYEARPFPGYAPGDDAASLLDRCRSSPFLRALDLAVAPDARVLDAGCGTGQVGSFLALAAPRRRVLGADRCAASLAAAEDFRRRAGIRNLSLLRADIFALPLDVVISRGVVHHTPDPERATLSVCSHVRPGGVLLLGIYESIARLPHHARRRLSLGGRRPIAALDPVLRRRDLDDEKKRTWIEDQYRHPLEHSLSFTALLGTVKSAGLHWLSSVPPAVPGGALFQPTPEPGAFGLLLRRWGWALRCLTDEDAGLVCLLARRPGGREFPQAPAQACDVAPGQPRV